MYGRGNGGNRHRTGRPYPRGGMCTLSTMGKVFMVVGGLLLILFVPFTFWLALLGGILVVAGFILWRCF